MDVIDTASENEALQTATSIANARKQPREQLAATGFCRYCQEPVTEDERFCDADCRDDYEWSQRLRKRNRY